MPALRALGGDFRTRLFFLLAARHVIVCRGWSRRSVSDADPGKDIFRVLHEKEPVCLHTHTDVEVVLDDVARRVVGIRHCARVWRSWKVSM